MFEPLTSRLRSWHLRNVTRRRLALLDARLLADIGANKADAGSQVVPLPLFGDHL